MKLVERGVIWAGISESGLAGAQPPPRNRRRQAPCILVAAVFRAPQTPHRRNQPRRGGERSREAAQRGGGAPGGSTPMRAKRARGRTEDAPPPSGPQTENDSTRDAASAELDLRARPHPHVDAAKLSRALANLDGTKPRKLREKMPTSRRRRAAKPVRNRRARARVLAKPRAPRLCETVCLPAPRRASVPPFPRRRARFQPFFSRGSEAKSPAKCKKRGTRGRVPVDV